MVPPSHFHGAQRRSYRFRLSIVSGVLNSTTASPQLHELSVLSSSARSRTASAATLPDAQRRHLLISLLPCCADRIASGSICNNSSASNHSRIYPNKKVTFRPLAICRPLSSPAWNASLSIKCPRYCKHSLPSDQKDIYNRTSTAATKTGKTGKTGGQTGKTKTHARLSVGLP